MSYDIYLNDPVTHETLETDAPHEMRGGTYCIGGTTEMHLNVTYNYSKWYYEVFGEDGIRSLYGKTGAESIPMLKDAIGRMSDEGFGRELEPTDEDLVERKRRQNEFDLKFGGGLQPGHDEPINRDSYWVETREHALRPLHQLLALAQMRPDGVWDGD
jgi:hypothetical protein